MVETVSAPAGVSQPADAPDLAVLFAGQARLLARRAEQGLPVTSGSLQWLVQLGQQVDAELAAEGSR
jgi:hypothetical protein